MRRRRRSIRRVHPGAIPAALATELAAAMEIALLGAVRAERRVCAAECTRRGDLWQKAAEKPGTAERARLEAESRANEAIYLADLIASRA
jgi:hypothetical protein